MANMPNQHVSAESFDEYGEQEYPHDGNYLSNENEYMYDDGTYQNDLYPDEHF